MNFLLGAIFASVFFILILFVGFVGFQLGHKKTIPPPQIDDEEQRKAKKIQEDFAKLMTYDVEMARQSKKVISGE